MDDPRITMTERTGYPTPQPKPRQLVAIVRVIAETDDALTADEFAREVQQHLAWADYDAAIDEAYEV